MTRSRLYVEDGRAIAFSPGWAIVLTPLSANDTRLIMEGIEPQAEGFPVISALADDIQVLLWTIAFVVFCAGAVAVFFGQRLWPQLTIAWAGFAVWLFLMFVQPTIAFGIVGLVVVAVATLRGAQIRAASTP